MEPHELIKTPCSENWDCMSGDEQKRFCDKCQHHVHDLTGLTLEEVNLLRVQHKGRLCGSFRLGRSAALGAGILSLAACQTKEDDNAYRTLGELPSITQPHEDQSPGETKEKPEDKTDPPPATSNEKPSTPPKHIIVGMICPPPGPSVQED